MAEQDKAEQDRAERIAAHLFAGESAGEPLRPLPAELMPADADAAYAVQDRLQVGFAVQPALGYLALAALFGLIAWTQRSPAGEP